MDDQPDADKALTPNPEHLAKLKEGVKAWNAWRKENPGVIPELQGAPLDQQVLPKAHLEFANLKGAHLRNAHLEGAFLGLADLRGAKLRRAHLERADLGGAKLGAAVLWATYLQGAMLRGAHLEGADLTLAHLEGADLLGADLRGAWLLGTRADKTGFAGIMWRAEDGSLPDPALYRGFDVRGIRYSDPLFDQFVRQSEFIRRCRETWPRWAFWPWKVTCNCGRSLLRWLLTCSIVIIYFGLLFLCWDWAGNPLVELARTSPKTWLTPFYFSAVTFSTLGFGDVAPCHWGGELAVMAEVFLGYVFLGGAISIFTTKFLPPR